MLRFPYIFLLLFSQKDLPFLMVPLLKVLPSDNLKFICLSVLIFVWAVNNVKINQLLQKLDKFFIEVTLVCTPKFVNVYQILFTGLHRNIEYLFIGYNFFKNWKMAKKFWYVFEIHRFALHMKICYCIVHKYFYRALQKLQYINIFCSF